MDFWAKPLPKKWTVQRNHHPKTDFWVKPSPKNRLLGETVTQTLTFGRNRHPKIDFKAKP